MVAAAEGRLSDGGDVARVHHGNPAVLRAGVDPVVGDRLEEALHEGGGAQDRVGESRGLELLLRLPVPARVTHRRALVGAEHRLLDDVTNPSLLRGRDDGALVLELLVGLRGRGSQEEDAVGATQRRPHRLRIAEVALSDLGAIAELGARRPGVAREDAYAFAAVEEQLDQPAPNRSGPTSDEDHRNLLPCLSA